ncbi:MAG: metalloregulator ArsR/SmtB family transcription factor [Rhodospirillaceae bacterium]|nr:metalloregulator ArsR/SmtB family transcription factor [Rhodospirillaceae bacterium]MDE0616974.1 metalloregulator ArsR/SmtB family transcription factor [Rhodospirillaceae bacterium]
MEINSATEAFAALSQETRLAAFRLLVRAGPAGLPAGEIARALGAAPSTLSTHLGLLQRAGLVTSERRSRLIVYRADFDGVGALMRFLMEDCCKGHKIVRAAVRAALEDAA